MTSIGKLKEILSETLANDFINEGFSFNKSQFSFSKRNGKNRIKSQFMFYDFSPSRVEFHFNFMFFIDSLEVEIKRFYDFFGLEYKKGFTILLREGDFHPKVKNEVLKLRAAYTHILYNFQNIESIEECRKVLKNDFFPRLQIFSELTEFQRFVQNNYEKVIDYGIVTPSLIALKIKDHNAFKRLTDFVKARLQIDEKDEKHSLKQLINNLESWL